MREAAIAPRHGVTTKNVDSQQNEGMTRKNLAYNGARISSPLLVVLLGYLFQCIPRMRYISRL